MKTVALNQTEDKEIIELVDLNEAPLYTAKEEKEVFKKYAKTHDPKIKKDIIKHNVKLVASIAKSYVIGENVMTSFEDLFQEGILGLDIAIDKYEPATGNKFSTYAVFWIKQKIRRYLCNNARTIRRPVHLINKKFQLKKLQQKRELEGKEPLSWDEIKKLLDLTDNYAYKRDFEGAYDTTSLDANVNNDYDDPSFLVDYIPDPNSQAKFEKAENFMLENALEEMLQEYLKEYCPRHLRKRNEDIIRKRTGVGTDGQTFTLEELGKKHGITRERARQVEERFIRFLTRPQNAAKLKGYI